VDRKAVPQRVGVDIEVEACHLSVLPDNSVNLPPFDAKNMPVHRGYFAVKRIQRERG
jgi:hypothetical protein